MTRCPDPYANPDDCSVCHGWGHLCSAWRKAHPAQAASVEAAYEAGWDPAAFYTSTAAARKGEALIGRARRSERRHD